MQKKYLIFYSQNPLRRYNPNKGQIFSLSVLLNVNIGKICYQKSNGTLYKAGILFISPRLTRMACPIYNIEAVIKASLPFRTLQAYGFLIILEIVNTSRWVIFQKISRLFCFLWIIQTSVAIKLWGTASLLSEDTYSLSAAQLPEKGKVERIIQFNIDAIDENCRKHIQPHYTDKEYGGELLEAKQKIKTLTKQLKQLENIFNGNAT